MTVRVNKPPAETYDHSLIVDARWTVAELRLVIKKEIGIVGDDLRIFKGASCYFICSYLC